MAEKKTHQSNSGGGTVIQLNLPGALVLSLALVVTAALVTYGLVKSHSASGSGRATSFFSSTDVDSADVEEKNPPPWGQMVMHDIELEQPEEYVAYENTTNRLETWTFENMTPADVRAAMQSCGMSDHEIEHALSAALMTVRGGSTVVTPDAELIFSLASEIRAKLYKVLARFNSNELMRFPFCFHTNAFEAQFRAGGVDSKTLALFNQLAYQRGNTECFSDLDVLLQQVPDDAKRLQLVKALSQQSAVMARIRIWPDTDVDKLIGYWGRGIQEKDVRPLLEAQKRLPKGDSMSILYFLPEFARQRLYTFPEPSHTGDPIIDCHWSTMNFFNDPPDNRYSNPQYISACLMTNYYQIAKPTAYGDVILLMDDKNEAIHSAVYLADDIVFTKNGNNFAQPWMLMRLNDLEAEYTTDVAPRMVVYRNKNW